MPQCSSVRREEESPHLRNVLSLLETRYSQAVSEREAAPALFDKLVELPHYQRRLAAVTEEVFHTPALSELLAERSAEDGGADALELAWLAVAVANRLEPKRYGASLVNDLRASAWAQLGEARRRGGDPRGAAEALSEAERLVDEGSGDPLVEGDVLERQAALLADQGDAELAVELLGLAAENYESVADAQRSASARLAADDLARSSAAE